MSIRAAAVVCLGILLWAGCKNPNASTTVSEAATAAGEPKGKASTTDRAWSLDDNVASFPDLGFSVIKPSDWFFVSPEGRIIGIDELPNERERAYLEGEPLVTIAKRSGLLGPTNPCFKVIVRPLGTLRDASSMALAEMSVRALPTMFPEMQVSREVEPTVVSGLPAAYYVLYYGLEDSGGTVHPMYGHSWIVKRGPYAFVLGAVGPAEGPDANWDVLEDTFNSVVISPRGRNELQ